jgi:RNA polymerase sigma-70 factor, ECF subfamily
VKRAAPQLRLYVTPEPPDSPLTLEQAFREHSAYVARVATRLLGRSDEVDDLVQDVFLRAMRDLAQLREPSALRSWLATMTARMARRRLRMRKLRRFFGLDAVADYEALADPAATPEQRALLGRVYAILDELPVELRLAWALRYAEGERLEAVAEISACSLATVKRRIGRAQELIERAIRDG